MSAERCRFKVDKIKERLERLNATFGNQRLMSTCRYRTANKSYKWHLYRMYSFARLCVKAEMSPKFLRFGRIFHKFETGKLCGRIQMVTE